MPLLLTLRPLGGVETHSGSGSLALTAVLTSDGLKYGIGDGALSVSASLSSSGLKSALGAGALSLAAALSSDGAKTARGSGALSLGAILDGDGTPIKAGDGTMALTLGLSAAAYKEALGSGSLVLVPTFFAEGEGFEFEIHSGSGALALSMVLAASGRKKARGSPTLALSAALAASGTKRARGSRTLHLTPHFASSGTKRTSGSGSLVLSFGGLVVARKIVAHEGGDILLVPVFTYVAEAGPAAAMAKGVPIAGKTPAEVAAWIMFAAEFAFDESPDTIIGVISSLAEWAQAAGDPKTARFWLSVVVILQEAVGQSTAHALEVRRLTAVMRIPQARS